MEEKLISTLQNLEQFGLENDGKSEIPSEKMLNITHETGEFLSMLIKISAAKNVLEVGTSNGYSTIWLADAVKLNGGKVTTLEADSCRALLAKQNFAEASVDNLIELRNEKASEFLSSCQDVFDFIFLDAERRDYSDWWPDLQNCLKPGGLIVVDNAVSHLGELVGFSSLVKITPGFHTSIVPVGKGELLIWKEKE